MKKPIRKTKVMLPAVLACVFAAALAGQASADTVPITLAFSDGNVTEVIQNPEGTLVGDIFSAEGEVFGEAWNMSWTVAGDVDPVINFTFAVTNTQATASNFFASFILPTTVTNPTVTGGSVSGSLTDGNGNGATLTNVATGTSLYTALIDGVPLTTLMDAPFTYTVATPYGSTIIPASTFGTPIPSMPGPAVASSIAVDLAFNLSAGDLATFNGVFVVEPVVVPEPASVILIGLGLAAMAARGRRGLRRK